MAYRPQGIGCILRLSYSIRCAKNRRKCRLVRRVEGGRVSLRRKKTAPREAPFLTGVQCRLTPTLRALALALKRCDARFNGRVRRQQRHDAGFV